MTTSTLTPNEDNSTLINTTSQLSQLIESFVELGVLVHDNQGTQQSNTALIHKVNQLVSQLSQLTASPFTTQYPIPVDVISYIEDGRNPDIYTREFIEVVAKLNSKLKGKMKGFELLRDILSEKLVEEFPRLKKEIEVIRENTVDPKPNTAEV